MTSKSAADFDFDAWAALAKSDPEEFERQRRQMVDHTCEKLGGLQRPVIAGICWRIEQERRRSASPLQLCMKLSSLMWERYTDLADALSEAAAMTEEESKLSIVPLVGKDKP